jgi:hypothetical protein
MQKCYLGHDKQRKKHLLWEIEEKKQPTQLLGNIILFVIDLFHGREI